MGHNGSMAKLLHTFTPRTELGPYVREFAVYGADGRTRTCGLSCIETDIVLNLGAPLSEVRPDGSRRRHPRLAVYGAGPTSASYEWPADTDAVIARIRPGAAKLFLSRPCSEYLDRVLPLEDDWGDDALRMEERLEGMRSPLRRVLVLEEFLMKRMAASEERPAAVAECMRQIMAGRGNTPVSAVVDSVGLSQRMMQRHFDRWVGMGIKLASRITRFSTFAASLKGLPEVDWAGAASDAGYADQAHMIRDFREFLRMTPTQYLAAWG